MNSTDESTYHPSAAKLQKFEQRYRSHDPNLQSELEQFMWQRLLGFEGPSIDVLHGEEPAEMLNWMLHSAEEEGLGKTMRAAMLAILRRELPSIHEQDDVQRVAMSDLLGLIETSMPRRVVFGDATWRTASYLRRQLCHEVAADERLWRWYQTRSPTGIPLLSRLLRSFALLQRDGSLAPFWMNLLKNESAPDVAIAAFDGLCRSVENDARVAWPYMVNALTNAPDKLARAIISFCRRNYLLKKNGEQPAPIQWHREIFDEGDQPIPQGRDRTEYVNQVLEYLVKEGELTAKRAERFREIALRPRPPRFVFLEPVDSQRFARWPAFHLMHWPIWAHRWVEHEPNAVEAVWINCNLETGRTSRSAANGDRNRSGMPSSEALHPSAFCAQDLVAPIDQGIFSGDQIDWEELQRHLIPIRERWKPEVIISPNGALIPEGMFEHDTLFPPRRDVPTVDAMLRLLLPQDSAQPTMRESLLSLISAATAEAVQIKNHARDIAARLRRGQEKWGWNEELTKRWVDLAMIYHLVPKGEHPFEEAIEVLNSSDDDTLRHWAQTHLRTLLKNPQELRTLGAYMREHPELWDQIPEDDKPLCAALLKSRWVTKDPWQTIAS